MPYIIIWFIKTIFIYTVVCPISLDIGHLHRHLRFGLNRLGLTNWTLINLYIGWRDSKVRHVARHVTQRTFRTCRFDYPLPLLSCGLPLLSCGLPFLPCGLPFLPCGLPFPPCGLPFLPCGLPFLPCELPFLPCGLPFLPRGPRPNAFFQLLINSRYRFSDYLRFCEHLYWRLNCVLHTGVLLQTRTNIHCHRHACIKTDPHRRIHKRTQLHIHRHTFSSLYQADFRVIHAFARWFRNNSEE